MRALTSELPVEIFQWDLDDGTGLIEILVNSRWWRVGWKFLVRALTSELPIEIFQWDLDDGTGLVENFPQISVVRQDWLKFFLRSRWWNRTGWKFSSDLDDRTRLVEKFSVRSRWWTGLSKFSVRSHWWTGVVENFRWVLGDGTGLVKKS